MPKLLALSLASSQPGASRSQRFANSSLCVLERSGEDDESGDDSSASGDDSDVSVIEGKDAKKAKQTKDKPKKDGKRPFFFSPNSKASAPAQASAPSSASSSSSSASALSSEVAKIKKGDEDGDDPMNGSTKKASKKSSKKKGGK